MEQPHLQTLWAQKPLTRALVAAIDPKADWSSVAQEARAMGWKDVDS